MQTGCYYVKPNYPGRSSHCCNAGFIVRLSCLVYPRHTTLTSLNSGRAQVDPKHRGLKLGKTLGLSYLHYGPLLGYKFSVFNLVYVTNVASLKIWDSLGFKRAGLVPKAGRLRCKNGQQEEEFVDAVVYWRDFKEPVPTEFQIATTAIA